MKEIPPGKKRILIVDDDDDVRDGLTRALALEAAYEVAAAADGFEAGYQFGAYEPDLVILDVVMPGMGGFDICQRMRALPEGEQVKVIILTGYPGDCASARSLIAGADLFLTKPQDVQTLLMHIEDLFRE